MSFPNVKLRNPEMKREIEGALKTLLTIKGKAIFVHHGGSLTGTGTDTAHPISKLDNAIGRCLANQGDTIFILPGHAETITAASAIDIDVAGVKIYGLGEGEDRPKITVSTANDASIEFAANSTVFKNIIIIAGKDGLTGPLWLKGVGLDIDVETRDSTDLIEAATFFLSTATSNYCKIKAKHQGFTTGSGNTSYINLVGADYHKIDIDYFGKANTSVIQFTGTSAINVDVKGKIYNHGDTTYSKFVVDTIGSSTWTFLGFDGETGVECSGSQDSAICATDTAGLGAAIGVIDAFHDVPAQNSADNVVMSDVVGNKTDTIAGDSIVALAKQIYARSGAPAGASLAADIAAIKAVVDILNAASVTEIAEILAAVDSEVADILTEVNKIETPSSTCKRLVGNTQIFTKNITSAANAAIVTVGTITNQSCLIKRIVLMSNGATTADLTSAAIKGGASQAVEFISAATAVKASIDAEDEQVSFNGAAALNAADTIAIDLQGTGATAVNLTVVIEYCACVVGGYIA